MVRELSFDWVAAKLGRLIEDMTTSPLAAVASRGQDNAEFRAESSWLAIHETLRAISVSVMYASLARDMVQSVDNFAGELDW